MLRIEFKTYNRRDGQVQRRATLSKGGIEFAEDLAEPGYGRNFPWDDIVEFRGNRYASGSGSDYYVIYDQWFRFYLVFDVECAPHVLRITPQSIPMRLYDDP